MGEFEELLARGVQAFEEEDYERALQSFRDARAIASPPALEYNIGRTLLALNRCREASAAFDSYLEHDSLSRSERKKGNHRLEQSRDECPEPGTLEVACKPEDMTAEVWVAGHDADCPANLELEPGEYPMRVGAPGYRPNRTEIEIRPGETTREIITLEARPAPDHPNSASQSGRRVDTRITQIAGLIVGGGLISAGLGSDLTARRRIRDLERARKQNDRARIADLQKEADRAQTRTVIFYAAGGAVTLAAGAWLTADLLASDDNDARVAYEIQLRPTGIAGNIRW